MCGIVGVLDGTGLIIDDKHAFTELLYADAVRGFHSTGVAAIPKNTDSHVKVVKKAVDAAAYLDMSSVDKLLSNYHQYTALIGHNRWATMGGITHKTAHPFMAGPITLVHNGTLRTRYDLPDCDKYKVDSENIAHSFHKIGAEETIKLLDGAFALVWHDSRDNKVRMVRNWERPLYFSTGFDERQVFFASEKLMLEWVLDRNKIPTDKIYKVGEKTMITFDLNSRKVGKYATKEVAFRPTYTEKLKLQQVSQGYNGGATRRRKTIDTLLNCGVKFNEKIIFKSTGFLPFANVTNRGRLAGYQNSGNFLSTEYIGIKPLDFVEGVMYSGTVSGAKLIDGETILMLDTIKEYTDGEQRFDYANVLKVIGPDGKMITEKKWDRITKDGCCMCADPIELEDAKDLVWYADDVPMCGACNEATLIELGSKQLQ